MAENEERPPAVHTIPHNIGFVDVTPALAETWLSMNKGNRKLREFRVRRYAHEMAKGEWLPSCQGIGFSIEGRLIDGQHRLAAVVRSGVTVPMLVVPSLAEELLDRVDVGANRSLGDLVELGNSTSWGRAVGVAARLHSNYVLRRNTSSSRPLTPHEILGVVAEHPGLMDTAETYAKRVQDSSCPLSLGRCVFLFYNMTTGADADKADAFIDGLIDGTGLVRGAPVHRLRERLLTSRTSRGEIKRKMSEAEQLALSIKAWRLHVQGEAVSHLLWARNAGEAFPSFTKDVRLGRKKPKPLQE
jgi:hypothetical protein